MPQPVSLKGTCVRDHIMSLLRVVSRPSLKVLVLTFEVLTGFVFRGVVSGGRALGTTGL